MLKKHGMAFGVLPALACSIAVAQQAAVKLNIEAAPLDKALNAWAQQTGYQILIPVERASQGRVAPKIDGVYTPEGALKVLLASTDLSYQLVGKRTVAIRGTADSPTAAPAPSREGAGPTEAEDTARPLVLAQSRPRETQEGAVDHGNPTQPGQNSPKEAFEQVVVTAQKRSERLQDVPVPVTALGADALVETNQVRLQDYYAHVPGLSLATDNRGAPSMAIRGVTTGAYVTPTVGVTIDDVPFGSTVVISSFSPAPDLDPNEISRVEVLRGPQGTLYGASSIGGLIKYVTIDPSTDGFTGRIQAGSSSIRNGDDPGYNVSGAVNVPLSDVLAIRANGFTQEQAGYIDNVQTGEEGINESTVYGGRVSALWKPSDVFTMKLSALVQRSKADGSSQVHVAPGLSDLEQRSLRGTGGYERKVQAFAANMNAKVGDVDLTSITGYGSSTSVGSYDVSSGLGPLTQLLFGVGGVAWAEDNETRKFSQEFRLTMPLGSRVDWLAGLFYTDERTDPDGGYVLIDPVTYERVSQAQRQQIRATYKEYAAFTDLTFHITDRFDIQVGGREGRNDQTYNITTTGPLVPIFLGVPSPSIAPETKSDDSSFTYLVTPQFRFSPQLMAYARFASGYRPGGPNALASGIPPSFAPDKTQNYEVGAKADLLDRRLSLDASVYYIRWKDIQLSLFDPATFGGYTGNGSRATSQGVEFSLDAKPVRGMAVSLWTVWNTAELSAALPANSNAFGLDGDRLPYSSRFSGKLALQQEFPLGADVMGFVGGMVTYVGDRVGEFTGPDGSGGASPRQRFPAYAKTDLRLGAKYDVWAMNLFVNNLTDRRGVLGGGLGTFPAFAFNYIQPRTIGLNVSRTF